MDAEEFAQLKEEYPRIYVKYIKKRKDDITRRKELVKQRKLERERALRRSKGKESEGK